MSYSHLLHQLYARTHTRGIKLGLETIENLNLALGDPVTHFKSIHVAGSNGKGSVCTKIAKALESENYKVGLYTSPHISSFRERMQINGEMISETELEGYLTEAFQKCDQHSILATFFEITTAIAFRFFADKNVDYAVVETGLGGRLDATNIVNPLLSIITSISFDHVEILGDSIEKITHEKAGIIKPNVPVIIGPRVPYEIVKSYTDNLKCPLFKVEGNYNDFNDENNTIAEKAMELLTISSGSIEKGLSAMPPCRLQIYEASQLTHCHLSPLPSFVVLDVAHNPDGLKHLFAALKAKFPGTTKIRVVCSLSSNKDIPACLLILKENAQHIYFTQAAHARASSVENIEKIVKSNGLYESRWTFEKSVKTSLEQAFKDAYSCNEIVVVCGTFYIMSQIRKMLGIYDLIDPLPLG